MRRIYIVIFILLTSFFSQLKSQTSNDILYGKIILEKIYLTEFDSAKIYLDEYQKSDLYSISPTLFKLMLKQAINQDLESLNRNDSKEMFTLCDSFIKAIKADNSNDLAWKKYMIGLTFFIQSAEKKRIGENFDAIQFGYDAVDYIEEAIELNPNLSDGLIGVGVFKYWKSVYTLWIPFFSDEREDAFKHFEEAKTGLFYMPIALEYQLIFIHIHQERPEKALEIVERWKLENQNSRLILWASAYVYRKTKKFDQAYEMYTKLFDYYIKTESIINQLELLKKRAICLNELNSKTDAIDLLASLKGLNYKHYSNDKVDDKVDEIKELHNTIKGKM